MGFLLNRKDLGKSCDEILESFGVDIDFLNSNKSLDHDEKIKE